MEARDEKRKLITIRVEWSGMRKTFHFTSIHYMAVVNKMLPCQWNHQTVPSS